MKPTQHASFVRLSTIALTTAVLATGAAAGPAAAKPKEPLNHVALGDSFAAGFGAGGYDPGDPCGRSPLGLPGLLDALEEVQLTGNGTCIGAKAAALQDTSLDVPEQIALLQGAKLMGKNTDLVTVSAGGNDLNFLAVVFACASPALADCEQAVAAAELQAETTLAASLDSLYAQTSQAAPKADVVVTGYPLLFSPESGSQALFSTAAQETFNRGTETLNEVIEDRAEAAGFEYVDVADSFEGHGIGSPDPWINFTGLTADDDLHPNAEGYRSGYLPEVLDEVDLEKR